LNKVSAINKTYAELVSASFTTGEIMNYIKLNTGVSMPQIGFGVFQVPDGSVTEQAVYDAISAGYRLIDTAAAYQNEESVGRTIKRAVSDGLVKRGELFVTTKLWPQDYGYENAKKAFETSLKKLDLDYIDLYLFHQPFGDYYGSYRAMTELYKEGKIRAIGCSNMYPDRLTDLCENFDVIPAVNQVELHPFFQQEDAIKNMKNYGVTPDIMSFAKSITNGMNPLAGFWAKEKFVAPDVFTPGSAHSTYCSNPLGVRAAYEVMSIVEEDEKKLEHDIPIKSARFMNGLNYLKSKYKSIGDVDGIGFALRIELTKEDGITPNRELCDALQEEGLKGDLSYNGKKCGLVLNNGGFYKNIITLVPQLYISEEEIDMAIDLFDQLFSRLDK